MDHLSHNCFTIFPAAPFHYLAFEWPPGILVGTNFVFVVNEQGKWEVRWKGILAVYINEHMEANIPVACSPAHVVLSFCICLVMLGCCPKWAHTHSRNQHCSYSIFDSPYCLSLSPCRVTDPTIESSVYLEPQYPEHGLFIVVSGMPRWKELLVASLAVCQHRVMWKPMRRWLPALSIDFGVYSNTHKLEVQVGIALRSGRWNCPARWYAIAPVQCVWGSSPETAWDCNWNLKRYENLSAGLHKRKQQIVTSSSHPPPKCRW